MRNFGIICEVNPLHNGHQYLIDSAKRLGADRIICVMSGNTVQRGDFAILDKYVRAEALVKCGADIVLELPFPWCSGSAESFSRAGISILRHFCDTVIFGSECGDVELLKRAAEIVGSEAFRDEYKIKLNDGIGAAGLYYDMIKKYTDAEISSNDLLGMEYIRGARELDANLNFVTVTRKGDAYMSSEITDEAFPSATALRVLWNSGKFEDSRAMIPQNAFSVFEKAIKNGEITKYKQLDAFWLSFFRLHDVEYFKNVIGYESGIINRFCHMSHQATRADELLSLVKTKRYTDAHIRRVMLYCLAGVKEDDICATPKSSLLLAANDKGRELLSENRKDNPYSVITKPADIDISLRQNILSSRIESIFALAHDTRWKTDKTYKQRPYIE